MMSSLSFSLHRHFFVSRLRTVAIDSWHSLHFIEISFHWLSLSLPLRHSYYMRRDSTFCWITATHVVVSHSCPKDLWFLDKELNGDLAMKWVESSAKQKALLYCIYSGSQLRQWFPFSRFTLKSKIIFNFVV